MFLKSRKRELEEGVGTCGIGCCHARFMVPFSWEQTASNRLRPTSNVLYTSVHFLSTLLPPWHNFFLNDCDQEKINVHKINSLGKK